MSAVDNLLAPERLRTRWQPQEKKSSPESAPKEKSVENDLKDEIARFGSEISKGWDGDAQEVLLGMHGRLALLADDAPSPERDGAMVEILDAMETLMDAYGIPS